MRNTKIVKACLYQSFKFLPYLLNVVQGRTGKETDL